MAMFRDRIEIEARRLEPAPMVPEDLPGCYPYPELLLTDDLRSISLDTVGFESKQLSATICPDLGGRILSLHDRHTDSDLIQVPTSLEYGLGGSRGVTAQQGMEVVSEGGRPLGMASLPHMVQQADEEEGSCFVYDPMVQLDVSLQLGYGFSEEQKSLNLEVLLVHRGSYPQRVPLALMIHGAKSARLVTSRLAAVQVGSGCVAIESQMPLYGAEIAGNAGLVHVLPSDMALIPAEAVLRRLKITPLGVFQRLIGLDSGVAIGEVDGQLVLRSLDRDCEGVFYILTEAEKTLEAPVQFSPGADWFGDIGSLGSRVARLRLVLNDGSQFETEFNAEASASTIGPGRVWISKLASNWSHEDPRVKQVFEAIAEPRSTDLPAIDEDDPLLGSSSLLAQTIHSVSNGDLQSAASSAENLLTQEAQSPINWWLAATISRERGGQDEESDPLLNAHFISPLEPMLRVEAFLRTPVSSDAQRSSILESLAKDPVASIDAVVRLYNWGLQDAAVRVLEDLLRLHPTAKMYLLLAGIYLESERFAFEADRLVKQVEELSLDSLYPHTLTEWKLLQQVAKKFPNSEAAQSLFLYADAARKKERPAS